MAEKNSPANEAAENEHDDDSGNNSFAKVLFEILFLLWTRHVTGVSYNRYPYYDSNRHVLSPKYEVYGGELDMRPASPKFYAFSARTDAFYLHGIGGGAWGRFNGSLFRFFGPESVEHPRRLPLVDS